MEMDKTEEMLDEAYDKIDGLESDLSAALDIIFRRGDDEAREWLRLNYPKEFAALRARKEKENGTA